MLPTSKPSNTPINYPFVDLIRGYATQIWGLWRVGRPFALQGHMHFAPHQFLLTANSWRILPYPTQPGQVGGHEGIGVVQKLGPGNQKSPIKLGDRVGTKVCMTHV